ncbi:MAG: hypothetical protein FWG06_04105 [Clostridiales bacterium]|nr:hypothetical protein [Clostridiales bacterium]
MFRVYLLRLLFRLSLAGAVIYMYAARREILAAAPGFSLGGPFTPLHILWALLMLDMLPHFFPTRRNSLAGKKQFSSYYKPLAAGAPPQKLTEYVKRVNKRAGMVMAVWLGCHALLIPLCLKGVIGPPELIALSAAYSVADLVCILFFCPFQKWFMKCRCCIDCRIFEWGHFMMFTPMLFFKSVYSCSLFLCAFLLLLEWEINFARRPRQFWPTANAALNCVNCRDKLCRIKRPKAVGKKPEQE